MTWCTDSKFYRGFFDDLNVGLVRHEKNLTCVLADRRVVSKGVLPKKCREKSKTGLQNKGVLTKS